MTLEQLACTTLDLTPTELRELASLGGRVELDGLRLPWNHEVQIDAEVPALLRIGKHLVAITRSGGSYEAQVLTELG